MNIAEMSPEELVQLAREKDLTLKARRSKVLLASAEYTLSRLNGESKSQSYFAMKYGTSENSIRQTYKRIMKAVGLTLIDLPPSLRRRVSLSFRLKKKLREQIDSLKYIERRLRGTAIKAEYKKELRKDIEELETLYEEVVKARKTVCYSYDVYTIFRKSAKL